MTNVSSNVVEFPRVERDEPFPEDVEKRDDDTLHLVAGGRYLGQITRRDLRQLAEVVRSFELPTLADAFQYAADNA